MDITKPAAGVMEMAFDKTTYDLAYQKKHIWQCKLNFHKTIDADIIAKLQSVPNRLGYIKALIRADIEKNR